MTRSAAVRKLVPSLVFAAAALAAAPVEAQYTYTKIMYPGSTWTEASGINDLGQVVGTYTDANGIAHGFLYQNGVYTTVDFPGAAHNYAFGISEAGEIVGSFSQITPRGPYSASLKQGDVWTPFDFPGHETDARAINASGHIVGIYNAGFGTPDHGFLKVGDNYTSIDFPGAAITYVMGLNDAGVISGTYRDILGFIRGFIYYQGTYTSITHPTASETVVTGINNANQVVGWKVESGKTIGFVLSASKYRPVIVPFANTLTTRARAINDAGAIVGTYTGTGCSVGCSFLATPAPAATPICEQSLSLSYSSGVLNTQFTLRTNTATVWTPYLIVGSVAHRFWLLPIPVIDPAASISVPVPLGPSGTVTLASFLSTATHGTVCVDFTSLNTGP